MKPYPKKKYKGRRKSFLRRLVPVLILIAGFAGISCGIAGIWHLLDKTEYVPFDELNARMPIEEPVKEEEIPETNQPEKSASENEENTEKPFGLVPKTQWVNTDYFDDALFIGDSITEGIKLYNIMGNAKILSHTGINLDSIFTKKVIKDAENGDKTIIEASRELEPKKIYVLMGVNSIGSDPVYFIQKYGELIDELKASHPDSIIYIQSIFPVTKAFENNRPDITNKKIDEYNELLLKLAVDKEVYFINQAEDFKDDNGCLFTEASPKDGMHFSADWYRRWFDYLRTHAY